VRPDVDAPLVRLGFAEEGIMEMTVVLFVAALFVPPLAVALGGLSLLWRLNASPRRAATKPVVPATS